MPSLSICAAQLKEIRNRANHELTISTDEYIYQMRFPTPGEEKEGEVPVNSEEMGTYELKFDPASQFAMADNQLEGLHDLFDKAVSVMDQDKKEAHHHHKHDHGDHKQGHGDHKQSHGDQKHHKEQKESGLIQKHR